MIISGWGMYPKVDCELFEINQDSSFDHIITLDKSFIPFGNGRSYGDSALGDTIVNLRPRDYFLGFDDKTGLLNVQAGVLLSEILNHFVPRGWFLKITPGTKLITVGGAIASDVHGKNHHIEGCFSECVEEFSILLANGNIVNCSKQATPDLFRATCGGQGLTGIILDAKIQLKRIKSQYINQTTIKTRNLKETFETFERYANMPYSVAWIDCLAKGVDTGRCLLMTGDFGVDGDLNYKPKTQISPPFNFPSISLNYWSVSAFNFFYYNKVRKKISNQKVGIDSFFYPLDSIGHWNRIYGKNGFIQYQFILPLEKSFKGLSEILATIAASGKGSFLAVLKLYGDKNENWLSFPFKGYSLALDFKIENGLFDLLNELDKLVIKYKGRIYLAKDARVTKEIFEQGYPNIEKFRKFRIINGMDKKFQSLQSKRLGI